MSLSAQNPGSYIPQNQSPRSHHGPTNFTFYLLLCLHLPLLSPLFTLLQLRDRLGSGTLLLQCCHACTWTHLSSSNRIQRNCMGLKITACMCTWGKFWTKDTKRPKNSTATFEDPGAKGEGQEQKNTVLRSPPAHNTT